MTVKDLVLFLQSIPEDYPVKLVIPDKDGWSIRRCDPKFFTNLNKPQYIMAAEYKKTEEEAQQLPHIQIG